MCITANNVHNREFMRVRLPMGALAHLYQHVCVRTFVSNIFEATCDEPAKVYSKINAVNVASNWCRVRIVL